eukprot:gnl/TRDRNA2_/TRDRNA2_150643_c1_seq4.p1 gnl/TRDRNA2_/TRDRNA2_150643_c1~~gnl/TRDRNA2_/TRDRNA2_150643_c1_seq4.p1  ORF type:complete len:719 (+),score=306.11 gnl/TRDRNA2_/TRDRNA2_150643_c1_seq4:247-2157(+)
MEAAMRKIKAMKTAVSGSLVQLKDVSKMIQRAALIAEALGKDMTRSRRVLTLLQQSEHDVPSETYEFQSEEIIEMLENLHKDFVDKKESLMEEETEAEKTYDEELQTKTDLVKEHTTALKDNKKTKSELITTIAEKSQDLSTTSATLLDDQTFLTDLSAKCNEKAVMWDSRTKVRAEELQAITTALTIIKDLGKEEGGAASFFQVDKTKKHKHDHHGKSIKELMEMLKQRKEALKERMEELKVAEAKQQQNTHNPRERRQRREHEHRNELKHHHHHKKHHHEQHHKHGQMLVQEDAAPVRNLRHGDAKVMQIVNLLTSKASKLSSPVLLKLVTTVKAAKEDPLAKVKTLIEELIERLLKEAAEEASHKGWCDKEIGLAEQKRGYKADTIKETNDRMAKNKARQDKLTELIDELKTDLKGLETALEEGETMRAEEKEENEQAIKDAEKGKEAVEKAIETLEKYYKKAGKASAALLIETREKIEKAALHEEPDAGFDSEYAGSQGESTGVIAMLEVIKSDCERTMKETEKAEKMAEQDFDELSTTSEASKVTKKVALEERNKALNGAKAAYDEDSSKMKAAQKVLDSTLEELNDLYKACGITGESAEERKQKREEELDALKQALCILNSQEVGSAESC